MSSLIRKLAMVGVIAAGSLGFAAGAWAQPKKIVAFYPGSTDTYVGAEITALKEEAKMAGYELQLYENGYFDQPTQDGQVQQFLALGETADLFLWWPSDREAGLASLRAIAKTGAAVIQVNQPPTDAGREFLKAFVGDNIVGRSTAMGAYMIEARDRLLKAGKPLHSEWGNAIVATYPSSYASTQQILDVFKNTVEPSGINVLGVSDEGFGAANGYTGVAKLIAKFKDTGIDLVFAMDDQILQGAVKALEEAGYTPGEDVMVIGAVCHGDRRLLSEGKQISTTLQSPIIEAQLTMKVAKEYLEDGKVSRFTNLMPNIGVRGSDWEHTSLVDYHGKTRVMDEICPWS